MDLFHTHSITTLAGHALVTSITAVNRGGHRRLQVSHSHS